MMIPATFFRLKAEPYYTKEELLEELSRMASYTLEGYLVGKEEESLYLIHSVEQAICEQTYQALFSLYSLVEKRILADMDQIRQWMPLVESEAPYALFGRGTTACFLAGKQERLRALGRLEEKMKKAWRPCPGAIYERKGKVYQSDSLRVIPIDFKQACLFVSLFHRHHAPPVGHKFSIACLKGTSVEGVAGLDAGNAAGPCGRPVSKTLDDGFTLEVSRLCTTGEKNVCSMLYSHGPQIATDRLGPLAGSKSDGLYKTDHLYFRE